MTSDTTTVTFPSAGFPGPVALTMDCPDGWYPLDDVATQLAVAKRVPEGAFRPNVIATVTRVRAAYTIDDAVQETVEALGRLEGYAEVGRETIEVDGRPLFRIEVGFTDLHGATMAQAVRVVVVERGPVHDVVQLTGSCLAPQVDSTWPEIRAIQSSLRIAP
jgi:hypothetical protein